MRVTIVCCGLLVLALSSCVNPVMLRDPTSGRVEQCLATGAFPLMNQQQCVAAHENMGWVRTNGQEVQQAQQQAGANLKAASDACLADMQAPPLDPIRQKVELWNPHPDVPPPFAIASNDTFPSEAERAAIATWADIRDACIARAKSASATQTSSNPFEAAAQEHERSMRQELIGHVGALIVALYHGKLTYGEFAQKRYEAGRDEVAAEQQYRLASMTADHERQLQAQQLAQQQFQTNLATWSTYMQAVNARQPQTVHLNGEVRLRTNCTSQQVGNTVDTSCN